MTSLFFVVLLLGRLDSACALAGLDLRSLRRPTGSADVAGNPDLRRIVADSDDDDESDSDDLNDPNSSANGTHHQWMLSESEPGWMSRQTQAAPVNSTHSADTGNLTSEDMGGDSSEDVDGQEAFVKIHSNASSDGPTSIDVEVATVNLIVSVYALMYVPLAMGWVMYFHNGQQESTFMMLLPLTLCTMLVGLDVINQSLAAIMASPMAITSFQAFSMAVLTGGWVLVDEIRSGPSFSWQLAKTLFVWTAVAIMFTTFQVVNHYVSYLCSLSERTVFLNLCPVFSMGVEKLVMPAHAQKNPSFNAKMALGSMVFGAAIFSIQFPDFTASGTLVACLFVLAVVPYRLVQRRMLSECTTFPVAWLALLDALVLLPPSTLVSVHHHRRYWKFWDMWLADSSICLMIVLSTLTFTGNHVCTLMLLKVNTATTTMVFQNLASFVEVGVGILFFGDAVLGSPLVFTGMAICLVSGLWYAFEVQPKKGAGKGSPEREPSTAAMLDKVGK